VAAAAARVAVGLLDQLAHGLRSIAHHVRGDALGHGGHAAVHHQHAVVAPLHERSTTTRRP
jgi:hypothetical protein